MTHDSRFGATTVLVPDHVIPLSIFPSLVLLGVISVSWMSKTPRKRKVPYRLGVLPSSPFVIIPIPPIHQLYPIDFNPICFAQKAIKKASQKVSYSCFYMYISGSQYTCHMSISTLCILPAILMNLIHWTEITRCIIESPHVYNESHVENSTGSGSATL
jgi:hypothetical protein